MENSYRKLEGLNQSLLKKILVSPGAFIKQRDNQEDSEQSHFVFGSLVDDMLLSDIDIEDKYYILKDNSVSDVLKSITKYIFDYTDMSKSTEEVTDWPSEENMDEIILAACNEYGYQNRWKSATRVEKIRKECLSYFL